MKIGLFTAGYRRNPLRHIFEDAAALGYDYIELLGERPHAYPPDLDAAAVAEIRDLSDSFGVPVLGYTPSLNSYPHSFMLGSEAMRRQAVDHVKRSIDVAMALGADFTMISPGHAGYETSAEDIWRRLVHCVGEIAAYAEQAGHNVLVEPLTPFESNVLTTAADLRRLLDEVPCPRLFGVCDTVPPFVQQEDILAYFDMLGNKLYHLHLVDSDGVSATHLVPGDGCIPLPKLLRGIAQRGYDRTATIELVTHYIHDPRRYAKLAIDRLRAMMER